MVKRYALYCGAILEVIEGCAGEYVRADDYDALAARLAEAEKERDFAVTGLTVVERRRDELKARLSEAERLLTRISKVPTSPMLAPIQHAAMKWLTASADVGSCTHIIHDGRNCSMCGAAVTVSPVEKGNG